MQEMSCAPGYPVECGDEHNVELPLPGIRHQSIQAGTPSLKPGNAPVRIFLHDLKSSLFRQLAKIVKLGFDVLVGGADAATALRQAARLDWQNDRQIGQLLEDEVWSNLNLLAPESTICLVAADRLRRRVDTSLERKRFGIPRRARRSFAAERNKVGEIGFCPRTVGSVVSFGYQ
jgi:hypothetical protein